MMKRFAARLRMKGYWQNENFLKSQWEKKYITMQIIILLHLKEPQW